MRAHYVLFIICFFSFGSNAQYTISKKKLTDIGIVKNSTASMALQADGKIVVAGTVQEGNIYKLAILRFTKNGDGDNSFGNKGIDTFTVSKVLPAPYGGAFLRSVTIQTDGKILVAGAAWYLAGVNYLSNVLVMRLNANGLIDSSFGDNGTVRTNINASTGLSVDDAFTIKTQPDGKIVVAGETYDYIQHRFLLIRYNTDGSADENFGGGGVSILAIGTTDDEAFSLGIQPDGKIVLAGESYVQGDFGYQVALARFTSKGIADNNFGSNGVVTTNVLSGSDVANDIAVQTDGKIVIGGFTSKRATGQSNVLCVRYNSNGSIDTHFGNGGNVIIDVAAQDDVANKIVLQPDNKILLSGYSYTTDSISKFLSVRLLADGNTDNSYATNGIQTTGFYKQGDAAYGASLLSNEKIVLAGTSTNGANQYISLIRYKKDGPVDSSFGNNGKTVTRIGSSEDIAYKLLNVPWDKSLLVAGTANGYWAIAKYNPITLALDSAFGVNGMVSVSYKNPRNPNDEPVLAIDAQLKKIYLAGYTSEQITIIRLNKDGTLDKTFGKKGTVNYGLTIFYGGFGVQSNHKILLSGVRQVSSSGYDFIARLNYDGTIDSSFGTQGEVQHLPITANAIQMKKDGSTILLGGRVNSGIGVLSLKTDGTTDQSFGTNGLVYKQSSSAVAEVFFKYNLAQDQSGRILVSGGVQGGNFKYQFSVTRFLKTGVVDSSFAKNGLFVKDVSTGNFSDNFNEGISSYCSGSNCSVLTAGIKMNDGNNQSSAVIMVLKNDGSIDSLNNRKGYLDTSFFNDPYEASYAALIDTVLQSTAIMFVAGKGSNGLNSDFELIRLQKPFFTVPVSYAAASQINFAVSVTPNPAHSIININYTMPQAGNTEISLKNSDGKIIQLRKLYCNAGKQHTLIQLSPGITSGVYYITISGLNAYNICRLVVQ